MYQARSWLLSAGLAVVCGLPATQATPERVEGASVADLAWLAGHWRGEGFGGQCEEIWSEPMAGTMVGSFRLIKDGEVQFYEIMVLAREADGVVLKVKHFSSEFVAWEEKPDSVDFQLEEVAPNRARFNGLTMSRDEDELEIDIRMRYDDGTVKWEPIRLRRYEPGKTGSNRR